MSQTVRIALDAMGGDHGPAVVVAGADLALAHCPDSQFLFFGHKDQVAPLLAKHPKLQAVSKLVHADIAVRMEDKPSQALRSGRRRSSMWLAIDAVKKKEADTVVSAGNTGALMAMSKFELKMLSGIERPGNVSLARDCGYSAPLSASRSLWLFDKQTLAHRLTHQRHDRNTRHHPATQPGEPFAAQPKQVGAVGGRYQWNVLPTQRSDQSLGQEPMRMDHLRTELAQRLAQRQILAAEK